MKKPVKKTKKKCTGCAKAACPCNKKKKTGRKIPTPKAGRQKGNVKSQNMRKRSAY